MRLLKGTFPRLWLAVLLSSLLGLPWARPARAGEPAGPVTIRGKIAALEGQRLTVATATGEVRVTLAEPLTVVGVVAARLADITPGTFIGTAARTQADGTFRSLEVHIFPESMRGTGEGHRPWERPEHTMTNATVEEVVQRVEGAVLSLRYKGGEVKVVVPPDAPVVRYVPGDRSLIAPGASVAIIRAMRGKDGAISASRINVGVGGTLLPM